jgi:hypothetical protein
MFRATILGRFLVCLSILSGSFSVTEINGQKADEPLIAARIVSGASIAAEALALNDLWSRRLEQVQLRLRCLLGATVRAPGRQEWIRDHEVEQEAADLIKRIGHTLQPTDEAARSQTVAELRSLAAEVYSAHEREVRKGGEPYFTHQLRVVRSASCWTVLMCASSKR